MMLQNPIRVNRITRERRTLVVEEDGRSRTTFDMVCIPVPRKTNIRDISSTICIVWTLESHQLVIKNQTNQDKILEK